MSWGWLSPILPLSPSLPGAQPTCLYCTLKKMGSDYCREQGSSYRWGDRGHREGGRQAHGDRRQSPVPHKAFTSLFPHS